MNIWLKRFLCALASLLLLFTATVMSGCGEKEKSESAEALARAFVDTVIANDEDSAFDLMNGSVSRDDFDVAFSEMIDLTEGINEYTFVQTGWNREKDFYLATYLMTADNGREFQVQIKVKDGEKELAGFNIAENK